MGNHFRRKRNNARQVEPAGGGNGAGEPTWIDAFGAGLWRYDESALAELFAPDGYWRILFGISWYLATFSGGEAVARENRQRAARRTLKSSAIDPATLAPRRSVVAEHEVIEES